MPATFVQKVNMSIVLMIIKIIVIVIVGNIIIIIPYKNFSLLFVFYTYFIAIIPILIPF